MLHARHAQLPLAHQPPVDHPAQLGAHLQCPSLRVTATPCYQLHVIFRCARGLPFTQRRAGCAGRSLSSVQPVPGPGENKGIGFRCIPQLVAPIRVGGVHPRDERSRRLDLSRPFFLANALRPPGCGIHIGTNQVNAVRRASKSFKSFDELLSFSVLLERPLWWAPLYSRALTTICVDEVPPPRSRPTTVRQGNGGP
jgi:hypothetical protein